MERDTLGRLFWMSPYQQLLVKFYGHVLILDTVAAKNQYNYHLTTFTLIDGKDQSRNIAYCIHSRQDYESFLWMFNQMKSAMAHHGVNLDCVFTDRAAAIAPAVSRVWEMVFHGFCLYHISENLKQALKGRLGDAFGAFIKDFWEVYRSGSPIEFERGWLSLLNRYSGAREYLMREIYPVREQWAWAWVCTHFTAGTRTTGRVEVEHYIYKRMGIGRGYDALFQLFVDSIVPISINYLMR